MATGMVKERKVSGSSIRTALRTASTAILIGSAAMLTGNGMAQDQQPGFRNSDPVQRSTESTDYGSSAFDEAFGKSDKAPMNQSLQELENSMKIDMAQSNYCAISLNEFTQVRALYAKAKRDDLSVFTNAMSKTIDALTARSNGLKHTFIIPVELMASCGIDWSKYGGRFMDGYDNVDYWKDLQGAMAGYGHVEFAHIDTDRYPTLLAKRMLPLRGDLPTGALLITNGPYAGFFRISDGDMLVPGVAFYRDLLNGNIRTDQFAGSDDGGLYSNSQHSNPFKTGNYVIPLDVSEGTVAVQKGNAALTGYAISLAAEHSKNGQWTYVTSELDPVSKPGCGTDSFWIMDAHTNMSIVRIDRMPKSREDLIALQDKYSEVATQFYSCWDNPPAHIQIDGLDASMQRYKNPEGCYIHIVLYNGEVRYAIDLVGTGTGFGGPDNNAFARVLTGIKFR